MCASLCTCVCILVYMPPKLVLTNVANVGGGEGKGRGSVVSEH